VVRVKLVINIVQRMKRREKLSL